jgi:plasmid stabilization system protein ParE
MFSPEAMEQLSDLYQYIAFEASPEIALGYTEAIVNYCESLCIFPLRGTARDDVRPGLRVTNYKKRAVIAFAVEKDLVYIVGIFMVGKTMNRVYLKSQATTRRIEILKGTIHPCPNPNTPPPRSKLLAINSTCALASRWSC